LIGAMGVLRRYERARKGHNLAVQSAMDSLNILFSTNVPIVSGLRNIAMKNLNRRKYLKRLIIYSGLGDIFSSPNFTRL